MTKSEECSMEIGPDVLAAIRNCVASLPLWSQHRRHSSVVLVGSRAAGLGDQYSDVDVHVLVSEPSFTELLQPIWSGVDRGTISILNPRARLFNEYPLTYIPGVDGHYQIKSADEIEARIRSVDDVLRWIYCNSVPITDESGLHGRIRRLAAQYAPDTLVEKRNHHLFAAKDYFYNLKTQLQRGHLESVALIVTQSISHLLKFFCFCDGRPFPYEKWLYQVGLETTLGTNVRRHVDAIMAEIRRDHVVYEKPTAYVNPGGRNEQFENYRLYHLFRLVFDEVEAFRAERFPEEVK
jgi:hypothetical protein